uniref:Uncharacterized protein n=1 Tax=Oryza rufipogon TaxID=4529 RepID=A0A0E0PM45_ORYRU
MPERGCGRRAGAGAGEAAASAGERGCGGGGGELAADEAGSGVSGASGRWRDDGGGHAGRRRRAGTARPMMCGGTARTSKADGRWGARRRDGRSKQGQRFHPFRGRMAASGWRRTARPCPSRRARGPVLEHRGYFAAAASQQACTRWPAPLLASGKTVSAGPRAASAPADSAISGAGLETPPPRRVSVERSGLVHATRCSAISA